MTGTSDGKSYTYDANGDTLTGAGRTMEWDADNRVKFLTTAVGIVEMDYDYTGIRVKKAGPLGVTVYPFSGYNISVDGVTTMYWKKSPAY